MSQSSQSSRLVFHLLALCCVVVWGLSFLNTRILLDCGLSPVEIFVYRFAVAYVGLLAVSRFRVRLCGWREELMLALCGVTGGSAFFIMQNTALDLTLMTDVAVLVAINPLLTTLLAAVFLREERFTWTRVTGSVIAFAGVALLTFHGGFVWGDGLAGDLLAFLAAFVWAVYSIILKRLNHRHSTLEITRKTFFYGLVTALPVMLLQGDYTPLAVLVQPVAAGNLLFLALVCSMAAFFAWGRVTKEIGAINATNYLYLNPIVSMIAAAALYNEWVGVVGLVGCALILAGILLVERRDDGGSATDIV